MRDAKSAPLSRLRLAAFAGPSLPLAALNLPLVVYLPEYFVSELGLGLTVVGATFMSVRLLDLAFDPLAGAIMDRTRTQWGRFRPWLAAGVPLLVLGVFMLFMAKPGVDAVYLFSWLAVVYVGYSLALLSHMSWASVLSTDYDQRSRIYAWWQGANVIGVLAVLALPPIIAQLPGGGHAQGVQAMGWFIIALLPITIGLAFWRVPEPAPAPARREDRAGLRDYLDLFKNASVRRILAADIIFGAGPATLGALFFFYFATIKDFDRGSAGLLLLICFTGGLLGGSIWSRLAAAIGKHRALAVGGLCSALAQLGLFLLPPGEFWWSALGMFLVGLPTSASNILLRSMMADVVDEQELDQGVNRTGLLYALLTGAVKISSAVGVFLTFKALDLFGFSADETPSGSSLVGLQVMFLLLPAAFALLGAWVILGYRLDARKHAAVRAALSARDPRSETIVTLREEPAGKPLAAGKPAPER